MVVIKDEKAPPLKWQMVRVIDVITGIDGIVREAVVRTNSGITKRAVTKLAVLPIDTSVGVLNSPTGGRSIIMYLPAIFKNKK